VGLEYLRLKDTVFRRELLSNKQKRLSVYQQNLAVLKRGVEVEIEKQKEQQQQKQELYQTTIGKRLIAEQEVRRLKETSKMLEKLIQEVAKKRDQSLSAEREAALAKKSFTVKKGSFDWPVSGTVILRFGRQKHPDLNIFIINDGIKLKTTSKSPVKSVEKGIVVYAADFRSYGPTVIVDHGGEFYTIYGLLGEILVKEGDKIQSGTALGSTPVREAQFYFEIRNQGKAEDPLSWLK
jgi:septal ring factor EnvC (AmiA/AmiB activator)